VGEGVGCYVCHPTAKLDHYLALDAVPGLDAAALHVNQNLKGLQECVAVPRVHVGEFRMLRAEDSSRFWAAVGKVVALLLAHGARGVALEVSYGDWIVHRPGSPHYHAHVHLRFDPYAPTLESLRRAGVAKRPPNPKPKANPETDVEADVTAAVLRRLPHLASSFLQCVGDQRDLVPLFAAVAEWFPGISGVLRVTDLDRAPSRYTVRAAADARDSLPAQAAVAAGLLKRKREAEADFGPERGGNGGSAARPPVPPLPPGWGWGRSRTYGNFFFFPLGDDAAKSWRHPSTGLEYPHATPSPLPPPVVGPQPTTSFSGDGMPADPQAPPPTPDPAATNPDHGPAPADPGA